MTEQTTRIHQIPAVPPNREDAFKHAQQAMTIALQMEQRHSIPMMDGTWLDLDMREVRKSICDDALDFMVELTLEENRVHADVMLERLNVYLTYPADKDSTYRHPEAVYCICSILALYEKAHSDFIAHFPDDDELLLELAMAGEAVAWLLRFLNNGRLPNMMRQWSATPRLVVLVESLRRAEPQEPKGDGVSS